MTNRWRKVELYDLTAGGIPGAARRLVASYGRDAEPVAERRAMLARQTERRVKAACGASSLQATAALGEVRDADAVLVETRRLLAGSGRLDYGRRPGAAGGSELDHEPGGCPGGDPGGGAQDSGAR